MLQLPTRNGWIVSWLTGETRVRKNGSIHYIKKSFESENREEVENKVKELKAQGFEIEYVTECIF